MWQVNLVLFLLRQVLGWFFLLARFRFFWDPSRPEQPWMNHARHKHLCEKMSYCGLHHEPSVWSWLTATVECGCGILLICGMWSRLAATGLFVLLLVATHCTWRQKITEQNPVDKVDWVSCYLWRVEIVYVVDAVALIVMGGGTWGT